MSSSSEPFATAVQHAQSGKLEAAERLCHSILQAQPDDADAMHLLGAIALESGRSDAAVLWISKAIKLNPENAVFHNSLGVAQNSKQQLDAAIASYRRALELRPRFAEAFNNLGNALKAQGSVDEAVRSYEQALEIRPAYADARNNRTNALIALEKLPEAIDSLEAAVRISPNCAESHRKLGRVLQKAGTINDAIRHYRRALELKPDFPDAHNHLGTAYQEQGELDEAVSCYEKAIQIQPRYAEALNNLGYTMHLKGDLAVATNYYRKALAARPHLAEAHTNLGNALRQEGNLPQAVACYQRALKINPALAEAHINLGSALKDQKKLDEAVGCYEAAIHTKPDYAQAHYSLGNVFYEQGRFTEAQQQYDRALRVKPEHVLWKLRRDTLCPYVFRSTDEIDEYRDQLEKTLERYRSEALEFDLDDLGMSGCEPPFNLNFHGRNNRCLKEKYASIFAGAIPQALPAIGTGLPHIGFVVTRGHEGVFLKSMKGIIHHLTPGLTRLTVICSMAGMRRIQKEIDRTDVAFLAIPDRLPEAAEKMNAARCDLLYYWEIGTDSLNYFLPFLRLAPVQCTDPSIQDTSGIPQVDYYLSSELTELDGAQEHYTERLIRLPTLPAYRNRVPLPEEPKRREYFGLREEHHIYLCAQNLLKFHPDFDDLLAAILRQDGLGRIVITRGRQDRVASQLQARFKATMPDVENRIMFLPRQSRADYLNLILVSDVMLDPLYFGGLNTTYEGLSLGTPIVTLPTEMQRSRYTFGCYQKMGVLDLAAGSGEDYVNIAVRLGTDDRYRETITANLVDAAPALFEDMEVARQYERFFLEAIERARTNGA